MFRGLFNRNLGYLVPSLFLALHIKSLLPSTEAGPGLGFPSQPWEASAVSDCLNVIGEDGRDFVSSNSMCLAFVVRRATLKYFLLSALNELDEPIESERLTEPFVAARPAGVK